MLSSMNIMPQNPILSLMRIPYIPIKDIYIIIELYINRNLNNENHEQKRVIFWSPIRINMGAKSFNFSPFLTNTCYTMDNIVKKSKLKGLLLD